MKSYFPEAFSGLLLFSELSTFFVSAAFAVPTEYAFEKVPSRFETQELTAGSRSLGEICLSRDVMPDGTVCNPAFLYELQESSFLGRLYLGNGYAALSTVNRFIYQPISKEFLEELFKYQNVTGLEAHAGLVFTTRNFSAAFSPYRVQYLAEVHNPNFPVVAIHASVERSFLFSGGTSLRVFSSGLSDFSVGARMRILERDFVHGSFSLFGAASENPRSLLPVQAQKGVFLDPFIGWVRTVERWKVRTSLGARNVGRAWPRSSLYPERADLDFGLGVEPPVRLGRFRLGVDAVDLVHGEGMMSRLRAGSSYRIGIMDAMLGWNDRAWTVGMQFGIQFIQVGVVYEFIRSDEGGSAPENRIATEFTVRL